MGLLLNVTPLQKLSARLATVPSREMRMLSPCTWWNKIGGRLFVPPLPPDLGAGTKQQYENLFHSNTVRLIGHDGLCIVKDKL
jgi:hypothetical protein